MSFKLPAPAVACLTTPVSSVLPKMRSIKGINILKEKRLNIIERVINTEYRLM
jgi:hypothetical protein